ncbi:phosphate/phosphite/phosphonate ABC transporter substrate-binding protein [Falsiroseomonas selenitidurans]|uniref:Phosphate/phosphite/phosphonate ABC transporter substrate-binding protein n=1 Tax=Falsiroseomonas selenitidurans TaxID=2716335 RepID=A0ABX1E7L7_9PROT|nr:phosphate/phosphite/phosphonate ABC transporter substrate-binding protein [Falsiroseomonas selenitidurans]NKC32958.1 phosphate/phosphite/phosphonate ABC transporter substrate-binding protein [Falsiroseomonas selenitidurans]OYW10593.1 MAG: phosphonate ABC transporter substrate-binding protein [Rhodospirillales bacterium 12-71-4]
MITRRLLVAGAAMAPFAAAAQNATMPAPGRRAWAAQVPQIRIGLLGGENEADRLGRYEAYRALMETTFGVPVRLFPAADYAGVMQAFSAGQIEGAGMGASAYAGAWLDTNGAVEPLWVAREADGGISYVSVMVVRSDSGITGLPQMRGKSLAWADANSTSGYLVPRSELRSAGIDINTYFSRTGFGGGHEQAVVAVLQRQYDAAVTWASGQGEVSQGFTRGNLRAMVQKGMLNMADLRIIWTSRPILNGPMTVRKNLPDAFKADFTQFHLALAAAHPQIYAQIERGGGQGYAQVTHEMFEPIVQLRREEAAERRRRS